MRHRLLRIVAAGLLAGTAIGLAPASAAPVMINDPTSLDWQYYGSDYAVKPITGLAIPGGAAAEIKVTGGMHPYDAGTNIALRKPIAKGRDYVISFWARTLDSNAPDKQGRILVRFFRNSAPFPGFGDNMLVIGHEWRAYEVSARATMDITTDAAVSLQLAGARQTLQIGQAHVAEGATTLVGGQSAAAPDPLPPQLSGKGELLNHPADRNWVTYGAPQTVEQTATDVYTRKAVLLTIGKASPTSYDAGVNAPIAGAIRKGDKLLVAVLARARSAETADGTGVVRLRVQSNQAPYDGWGAEDVHLTPGWKLFQWQTEAQIDLPANGGEIALHTGLAKQQVELGPVYVIRIAKAAN